MPKHVLVKLEKDLKDIKQALLVDIPQEIARAAGQGDLSENAEYEQALAKRDGMKHAPFLAPARRKARRSGWRGV